ncbi:MAG: hypothetical protein K9K37_00510 [Desulfocapsa sp.]|nr:hypothetical protein [Desulfocapsa sp.]
MLKKLYNTSVYYSKKTIVHDLLLWLVVLVTFVVSFAAASFYTYAEHTMMRRVTERADTLVGEISSILSVPLYHIDTAGVKHICKIYSQMPDLQGILVEDEQGRKIFNSIAANSSGISRDTGIYQGQLYLGHVTLVLSDNEHKKERKEALVFLLFTGLALILTIAVGIHIIMRYLLTTPLEQFNTGLADIAGGHYSTRLQSVQHDDLNCSVDAVNRMAGKIEKVVGELKITRDFLKNVLNSMPSIIIGVDSQCCITDVNLTAIHNADKKHRPFTGKPVAKVFPWLEGEVVDNILQSISEYKPITIIQKNTQIFGEQKHLEIAVYPLHTSFNDGAVVRVDDISTRIQLQEVMVQTEKMMSVGSLGAGMAHEINNPLAAILQAVQNVERRLSVTFPKNREVAEQCNLDPQALENYLQERHIFPMLKGIHEAGQRAEKVVQNMLKFSRYSGSTMESCVLVDIIDRVLELVGNDYDLKRKYDFKNLMINRKCNSDIVVKCNRAEIEQVLFNLLINAAQAFKAEDFKEGRPPEITIIVTRDEDFVTIEVIDNGPGIEEDLQRRIFEPFFTTKDVGEGTGLGLTVSYYIVVDQHKGALSVKSTVGQGTTFVVKLPVS